MKLINKTRYDPRTLRSVVAYVHDEIATSEGRLNSWDHLEVRVAYSKRPSRLTPEEHQLRGYSGQAEIGRRSGQHGRRVLLRLPHARANTPRLAVIAHHELLHSYGYGHGPGLPGKWSQEDAVRFWPVSLLVGEFIEERAPKPKPRPAKVDLQEARYLRVLRRQKRWATKAKRARTALAEIAKQRRYYEKALLAAGRAPKGDTQ